MKENINNIRQFLESIFIIHKDLFKIIESSDTHIEHLGKITYINDSFFKMKNNFKLDINDLFINLRIPNIFKQLTSFIVKQLNKKYIEKLLNFKNVLEQNFDSDTLKYFYSNYEKILIFKSKLDKYTAGEYYQVLNYITLKRDEDRVLNHELFHMATSVHTPFSDRCGFSYRSGITVLGEALNEGYTEIMTNRYFELDLEKSGYYDQIYLCRMIEDIIGKEKMEKLYLTSNIHGLIEELKRYADERQIVKFIIKTDKMLASERKNKLSKFNDNIYDDLRLETTLFLVGLKDKANGGILSYSIDNNIKDFYTTNNNINGKSFYSQLVHILSLDEPEFDSEKRKISIFGYNELKNICFKTGINGVIEKLRKYLNDEDISYYFDLVDKFHNINSYDYREKYGEEEGLIKYSEEFKKIYDEVSKIEKLVLLYIKVFPDGIKDKIDLNKKRGFKLNNGETIFENCAFPETIYRINFSCYSDTMNMQRFLQLYLYSNTEGFVDELKKIFNFDDVIELMNSMNQTEFMRKFVTLKHYADENESEKGSIRSR